IDLDFFFNPGCCFLKSNLHYHFNIFSFGHIPTWCCSTTKTSTPKEALKNIFKSRKVCGVKIKSSSSKSTCAIKCSASKLVVLAPFLLIGKYCVCFASPFKLCFCLCSTTLIWVIL